MEDNTYYIYNYPASWGMGSETDTCLVTTDNLHKIFSDDEIAYHLSNCTTYDEVPDLIQLPHDIVVNVEQIHMENVIFRVHNQFFLGRDIIVGEADFCRYFVNLSDFDKNLGRWFSEKTVYEFTAFDLKHVAVNDFFLFYKSEDLLEAVKDKIRRLQNKGYPKSDKQISEAEAIVKKFENLPELEDEYYKHFYHQKYSENKDFVIQKIEDEIRKDQVDHTFCTYSYPIMQNDFGCEVFRDSDPCRYLTYSELFHKGTNVRHLIADLVDSSERLGGFENPQIDLALRTVFGYD